MTNALPPAHWAADPSGRHEYRYWDGARWTDHVADQGRPALDPIITHPAPTAEIAPTTAQHAATPPGSAAEATAGAGDAAPTSGTGDEGATPGTAGESPASIAWRPEATGTSTGADANGANGAAGTGGSEPLGGPPERGDEHDPAEAQAGWAAPAPAPAPAPATPAVPAAAAPAVLAPPPPPPAAGTGVVTGGRMPVYGTGAWRSMSGLRTALVVLLVAMALSSVGFMVTFLNRIAAIDDFTSDPLRGAQPLRDADDAVSGASGIYSILRLAIIVVFIIWLWRASKNALDALGRERPTFTPGWTIGGWFIPFANFVIPFMIIQQLWRASAPGTSRGTVWRETKGSALVTFWWIVFLVSTVAMFTLDDNDKLDDVRTADTVAAVGAVASIVAAVLAIVLVTQLTRRFEERRDEDVGA